MTSLLRRGTRTSRSAVFYTECGLPLNRGIVFFPSQPSLFVPACGVPNARWGFPYISRLILSVTGVLLTTFVLVVPLLRSYFGVAGLASSLRGVISSNIGRVFLRSFLLLPSPLWGFASVGVCWVCLLAQFFEYLWWVGLSLGFFGELRGLREVNFSLGSLSTSKLFCVVPISV